jgi:endonuclease/exonuclease/phosphatase family metal-dependent hydrolase
VALLVLAAGCALVLALVGWSRLTATPGSSAGGSTVAAPRAAPSSFVLMQMNVCLSGMSGCYDVVEYPAGVRDVVARIRQARPDAVTLNEACRADAVTIGRRTGYHVRFVHVIYAGERLPCVDPGSRGLFGNAVLTRARVTSTETQVFEGQFGPEERRWLCVTTRHDQDVCTAHLEIRSRGFAAANDDQCVELAALLARRAAVRSVAFGGDVNRGGSCAPDGLWTRTDRAAGQRAGVQHVYGSRATLRSPRARALPAPHSDHDVLYVRARPDVGR